MRMGRIGGFEECRFVFVAGNRIGPLRRFVGDEGRGVVCVWVGLNDFCLLCDSVCCWDDVFIKHFGLTGYAATNTNFKPRTTELLLSALGVLLPSIYCMYILAV